MPSLSEWLRLLDGFPPEVAWLMRAADELFSSRHDTSGSYVFFKGTATTVCELVYELQHIASDYRISLEDAVWNKYSYKCPYCGYIPCECWNGKANPHRRFQVPKPKDFTLDELRAMLKEIYPPSMPAIPEMVWRMAVWLKKLHEEVWELVRARREESQKEVEEEFADVFARLMQIVNAHGIILDD